MKLLLTFLTICFLFSEPICSQNSDNRPYKLSIGGRLGLETGLTMRAPISSKWLLEGMAGTVAGYGFLGGLYAENYFNEIGRRAVQTYWGVGLQYHSISDSGSGYYYSSYGGSLAGLLGLNWDLKVIPLELGGDFMIRFGSYFPVSAGIHARFIFGRNNDRSSD